MAQQRLVESLKLTIETTDLLERSSLAGKPALAAELARLTVESHRLCNPPHYTIQLEQLLSVPRLRRAKAKWQTSRTCQA